MGPSAQILKNLTVTTAAVLVGSMLPAQAASVSVQPAPYFENSTVTKHSLLPRVNEGLPSNLTSQFDTVDKDPSVAKFMTVMPGADLVAVQQIFDLAIQSFHSPIGYPVPSFDMDMEESGPVLCLDLDTHGMETDEQLRREIPMREFILQDARLKAAKQYLVINIY